MGDAKPKEKKEMGFLLKKLNNKKQQREDPTSVENQVISLGMVQGLSKQISANELAAKGIKLSIKNQIIDFIKKQDSQI